MLIVRISCLYNHIYHIMFVFTGTLNKNQNKNKYYDCKVEFQAPVFLPTKGLDTPNAFRRSSSLMVKT